MTTYTKERKLFGQGLTASVQRAKERQATPLVLHHGLDDRRLAQLVQKMQQFIMPIGVSLVQGVPVSQTEEVARLEHEIVVLEARLELLKNQLQAAQTVPPSTPQPAPSPTPDDPNKWMTLTKAAKLLHVSYSTMWRAHADGRLVTYNIGGTKNDVIMCDPSTFRRKVTGKAG